MTLVKRSYNDIVEVKAAHIAVADPGGVPRGPWPPPSPVEISHKKMAAKGGPIDFMFLGPPYPATGSDAASKPSNNDNDLAVSMQ